MKLYKILNENQRSQRKERMRNEEQMEQIEVMMNMIDINLTISILQKH